jgi:lipoyl-dependent peroxiredoxin
MKRTSTAVWNGSGKEGKGHISIQSGVIKETPYGYKSRFEDGPGTNPEELIAAAHAGCFNMKLSFILGEVGYTPDELTTTSTVALENGVITSSHLVVKARVPGITAEKFRECAENAKTDCPVSKALNMAITMDAELLEDINGSIDDVDENTDLRVLM